MFIYVEKFVAFEVCTAQFTLGTCVCSAKEDALVYPLTAATCLYASIQSTVYRDDFR